MGKNNGLRENLRINFVGTVPPYVMSLIEQNGLEESIKIMGYLPHRLSIQNMLKSDVLLLLLNKVKSNTTAQVSTGKLFEYLAARRPILALIPGDTDAARLITQLGAGDIADPEDLNDIMESISHLYSKYQRGELRGHSQDIERFRRNELTRQLSVILDECVKQTEIS